jgi:hypothetical protein
LPGEVNLKQFNFFEVTQYLPYSTYIVVTMR